MCLELRLSGGQFHLARPAFPVWFVAIGNKLGEVSPLPPILAAVLAAYFKEEEGKKKPSRIFPLYALILGRRCPQHTPISWWAPVQERQEMTAGLWPSRGDQTPGQVGGKRWTLPGETWVMVPARVSHGRSSLSLSALPR